MRRTRGLTSKFQTALEQVAVEVPEADRRIRSAVGQLVAAVQIGGESFALMLGDAEPRVAAGAAAGSDIVLELSDETFDALLAGRVSLHDAIRDELVLARGEADALLSLGEALAWFLKGVLRLSRADELLDGLECSTSEQEGFT